MVDYIQKLVDHLQSFFGPYAATITVNTTDVALDIQKAIPCGLIINELVTNALKYAFPPSPPSVPPGREEEKEENEIRVELYAEDEAQLALVVSDNGVGIPPGLDWYDTSSLGLELVRILTQQLQGKVEVDTSAGTAFKVTFARPEVSKKPG
jgi:two-component sensor histidine kinase